MTRDSWSLWLALWVMGGSGCAAEPPAFGTDGSSSSSADATGTLSTAPTSSTDPGQTSSVPTTSADTQNTTEATTEPVVETSEGPTTSTSGGPPTTVGDSTSGGDETTGPGCVPPAGECDALACGTDSCGDPCPAQCDGDAFCAEDQSYCGVYLGNSDDLGTDVELNADIIFGHGFVAATSGSVRTLGVIAQDFAIGTGPSIELGIYSSQDADGVVTPSARLFASGLVQLEPGVNEIVVGAGVELTVGERYWVLLRTTELTPIRRGDVGGFDVIFLSTEDPMPPILGGETSATDFHYNLFATYEET